MNYIVLPHYIRCNRRQGYSSSTLYLRLSRPPSRTKPMFTCEDYLTLVSGVVIGLIGYRGKKTFECIGKVIDANGSHVQIVGDEYSNMH